MVEIARLLQVALIAMLLATGCTDTQAIAYCEELERLETDAPSSEELATGGDKLRTRVASWLRRARRLQAEAPAAIRASVATTVGFFTEFIDLLEKHGYDLEAMSEDPAARRLEAHEGELAGAQREIHAFNVDHCPADEKALAAAREG